MILFDAVIALFQLIIFPENQATAAELWDLHVLLLLKIKMAEEFIFVLEEIESIVSTMLAKNSFI